MSLGGKYDLSRATLSDRSQMDINKDEDDVEIDEPISFPNLASVSGQVRGPKCLFDDDVDDNDDRDCIGPSSGNLNTSLSSHFSGISDSLHQIMDQDAHFLRLELSRLNEDPSLFHKDGDSNFHHDGVCTELLNAWFAGIVDPISLFFHLDTEIDSGRLKSESGAFFKKAVLDHGGHSTNYLQSFEKRQIFTVNKGKIRLFKTIQDYLRLIICGATNCITPSNYIIIFAKLILLFTSNLSIYIQFI